MTHRFYEWRGPFTNEEVNALHAEAFDTRLFDASEWNWIDLTERHSLGWVTARDHGGLVGFVNVIWDGSVHAWLQDLMMAIQARHQGVGVGLVKAARVEAREAGCEWLHVDFDDDLRTFYYDACGFEPSNAGLMSLQMIATDGCQPPAPV
ncbi:MAG TPA: GNAT family N-acetyltransferase [Acidimicrobiia bacterium]|nr:GNAT family N-acetyltransferase [Acidimicrobiia bacterium]